MPDDRLIHLCFGHSEKINSLTDFERGVWLLYKLSADDFGIMRFSAATLREAADWLNAKPERVVLRALERVQRVGLFQTFEHQRRTYCYQWDWQSWQKITHPRQTKQPLPPADIIETCCKHTQWLFSHHPIGGKLTSWKAPAQKPGATPEEKPEVTPGVRTSSDSSDSGNDSRPVFVVVGSDRVGGRG